jgi:hypothetical protein
LKIPRNTLEICRNTLEIPRNTLEIVEILWKLKNTLEIKKYFGKS